MCQIKKGITFNWLISRQIALISPCLLKFLTYIDIRPKAISKRAKIERSEIFATNIHVSFLMDLLLGLQWWPFSQMDTFSSFESWNLFWHQTNSNQQAGKNWAKRDFCYVYTCFTLMDILLVFSQVVSFSSFES